MKPTRGLIFKLQKLTKSLYKKAGISLVGLSICLLPAEAQVIPDNSVGTQIDASGVVSGGTPTSTSSSGARNLFHSFQQFSLSPTDTVTFAVDPAVTNVISRVTGQLPSEINGTIQMVGSASANLFLINPAGITFGSNAQLRLPGSFIATTAESLTFANSETFSAQNLAAPPLTISVPLLGLQIGTASQSLQVNNTGHTLTKINPSTGDSGILAPHVQQGAAGKLQVLPGKTLALIGNGVSFSGGLATANSGNLEIGSVAADEQVNLVATPFGFVADYSQVESFADVSFSNRALANVSGVPIAVSPGSPLQIFSSAQGAMQVVGKDIQLTENSLLLGQSGPFSTLAGQPINVAAAGTLFLKGSDSTSTIRSGIFSETLGNMASGQINISANDISIEGGAGITSLTFTDASSGAIDANAERSLKIEGNNSVDQGLSSLIATASIRAAGESGNITVKAPSIMLLDSGGISSINFAKGKSGSINVESDLLILRGRNPVSDIPSTIAVTNYGPGTVGDVEIDTHQLAISETAAIAALSITSGNAGRININATERIDISGSTTTNRRGDAITSSVSTPSIQEQIFLGIPPLRPSGNAGDIVINTPRLTIDGAFGINAQSVGTGNAGNIQITADTFRLSNNGFVRGQTFNGSGGSIDLRLQDSLILRNGSRLTVESNGNGNGGNINITSPVVIALENSDIIASAIQGKGGNIDITAQSVLGTAYRDQLTPQSDITASSQFGIDGTVAINNPNIDPSSGAVVLPTTVLDPDGTVAAGCAESGQNQFIASGRGGFASDPRSRLESLSPWQDLRSPNGTVTATSLATSFGGNRHSHQTASSLANKTEPILEASSWQRNRQGQIELTNASSIATEETAAQCLKRKT